MTYKGKCNCMSKNIKNNGLRPCKAFALKYSNACLTHSRIKVIFIQSVWRAYRIRRKVKFMKKLPNDALHIIQHYMRYDHNIQYKLLPSYLKIYKKRFIALHKSLMYSQDSRSPCSPELTALYNKIQDIKNVICL